jgi:hypothetical protein
MEYSFLLVKKVQVLFVFLLCKRPLSPMLPDSQYSLTSQNDKARIIYFRPEFQQNEKFAKGMMKVSSDNLLQCVERCYLGAIYQLYIS